MERKKGMINCLYETYNAEMLIPLATRLLKDRIIFLNGEINTESATNIIHQLMHLKMDDSTAPITIYIDSPGGSVSAGLMIVDYINSLKNDIDYIVLGQAASMAAVILAAGKKGHRFITPYSKVMIHEPSISRVSANCTGIEQIAKDMLETKSILSGILSSGTGKSIDEINKLIMEDYYMNAKEAIEFGICDSIYSEV